MSKLNHGMLLLYILFSIFNYCFGQNSSLEKEESDDCPINSKNSNKTGLIIGLILIYSICISAAIFNLIYLYKFYIDRDSPNISNRHPHFVYFTVIIVVFMEVILFPLSIDFWTLECVTHTRWLRGNSSGSTAIEGFLMLSFLILLYAWLILVVLRVWLLRFDYSSSVAKKNQIWKKDLGVHGGSSTWWITNQMTWGREIYLLKIVSVPYFLSVLLSIILSPIIGIVSDWNGMTFTAGGIAVILLCFVIVNVWKVRSIHDNYHIKDEVLLFAKVSAGIGCVLLIIFIITRLISNASISNYIVLIWGLLVMIMLSIVSYIQTGWVLHGIERKKAKTLSILSEINKQWESNVTLTTILNTKEGFEIFMDFLVAEYSTENLLCYVESTHFLIKWKYVIYKMREYIINKQTDDIVNKSQNYVSDNIDNMADMMNSIDNQSWSFHDNETILIKFNWVKKSDVITRKNITFLDHFKYLKRKYIDSTSAHQVNIRSALYKHYTKIKDKECDLTKCDLSDIFNQNQKYINDDNDDDEETDDDNDEIDELTTQPKQPGESNPNNLNGIRRSQTQYNRNLRNLYGVVKVLQLIEDTRKELWKLMHDSFVRFRSTEPYMKYIETKYLSRSKDKNDDNNNNNDKNQYVPMTIDNNNDDIDNK